MENHDRNERKCPECGGPMTLDADASAVSAEHWYCEHCFDLEMIQAGIDASPEYWHEGGD
ncbi:MAG: hypothetical protein ABJE95_36400 [Byssovorax sp.]